MNLRFLVSLFAAIFYCTFASAQERRALVIGIDKYKNIQNLSTAENDARSVSAALDKLGFKVMKLVSPERLLLRRTMAEFSRQVSRGDEVVFYFAGHGIEVQGRNYLLPSDVPSVLPGEEDFVTGESIAADQVLDLIQTRGARVTLMILDACRNNPFPTQGTRSVGSPGGLSRMEPTEGSFILFSAGAGQTALDLLPGEDTNSNSVFTRAFLARLDTPGLKLHELVRQVRKDVRQLAAHVNHPQFPAYYDQLHGDFTFVRGDPSANSATLEAILPPTAKGLEQDSCDAARTDWGVLQGTQSTGALEAFVSTYSKCSIYVAAARDRMKTLRAASERVVPAASVSTANACEELWYARNLIYHNNGYCFQTSRARKVFDTSQCTTSNPRLTVAEQSEVQRLLGLESANGC